MSMTPEQEQHLARLKSRLTTLLDAKYRLGQREHGGNLWRKKILPEVLAETVDFVSYVLTLEEQVEEIKTLCIHVQRGEEDADRAVTRIAEIL